jgi:hypothetical protein
MASDHLDLTLSSVQLRQPEAVAADLLRHPHYLVDRVEAGDTTPVQRLAMEPPIKVIAADQQTMIVVLLVLPSMVRRVVALGRKAVAVPLGASLLAVSDSNRQLTEHLHIGPVAAVVLEQTDLQTQH